jgi:hypothetical protein
MGASQFDSPARLQDDGQIRVEGPQRLERFEMASGIPTVEYRFLLVQGGVVVKGSGKNWGSGMWEGKTDEGQAPLQKGPVLAVGLAIIANMEEHPGFTTFSWAEQIELEES